MSWPRTLITFHHVKRPQAAKLIGRSPSRQGLQTGDTHVVLRGTGLSPEAVVLLQQILDGRLALALEAPRSPATHEVEHLAMRALEHHLERRLRSVGLLDRG